MRFLADENIAPSIVKALRHSDHDVIDIKEKKWHGYSDQKLIAFAIQEGRIILTHDKDFTLQNRVSVILLRFLDQRPNNVIKHLAVFLSSRYSKKIACQSCIIILSEAMAKFRYI